MGNQTFLHLNSTVRKYGQLASMKLMLMKTITILPGGGGGGTSTSSLSGLTISGILAAAAMVDVNDLREESSVRDMVVAWLPNIPLGPRRDCGS